MIVNTLTVISLVLVLCWSTTLSNARLMKLVLLTDAPEKHGAMCLDGSPPGFHFRPGFGGGRGKWIVHLAGGGWCSNSIDCAFRARTYLGSTNLLPQSMLTYRRGIISNSQRHNPDFYNWNMVFVHYCDGGFFTGHREEPEVVGGVPIYYRGRQIVQAVFEALMAMGMKRASEVILTGCSAGGISTFVHADYVQSILPVGVKYVAMSDAGIYPATDLFVNLFIRALNIHNSTGGFDEDCVAQYKPFNEEWKCLFSEYAVPHVSTPLFFLNSIYDTSALLFTHGLCMTPEDNYYKIYPATDLFVNLFIRALNIHNSTGGFDEDCVAQYKPFNEEWKCLFSEYAVPHVSTPLFFLNSIYDTSALLFTHGCFQPHCPGEDLGKNLGELRELFLNASVHILPNKEIGTYFDACLRHCQSIDDSWFHEIRVDGLLARETFANWYFERDGETKVIDCEEFPCNDSCGHPRDLYLNESPIPN